MSAAADEAGYSLQRVQQLLGLSRSIVTGLIAAGFVTPTRGPRNQMRFGFQDLLLLRTAHGLQQARISPRKILRALTSLKASLPAELPVTGLRISAVGADVTVHDRSGRWAAESGQRVMDFEVAAVAGEVAFLAPAAAQEASEPAIEHDAEAEADAADCFRRGAALEAIDIAAAEAAYRRSILLDSAAIDASLNLGALLAELRRFADAIAVYDAALGHSPNAALLHYNRAIALEDLGSLPAAMQAYERALALDPQLADAHYNLGMLQERLGDGQGALRHFSAYRRLRSD